MREPLIFLVILSAGCIRTGPVSTAPQKVGRIDLLQTEGYAGQLASWSAQATAEFGADSCQYQVVGLCTITACPPPGSDAGVPDAGGPADVGPIAITAPGTTITLMPRGDGTYSPAQAAGGGSPVFKPGTAVTVQGKGGIVPAFVTTVQVPSALTLLGPTPPPKTSGPLPLDRGSDLLVSWGGAAQDSVEVVLDSGSAVLRCDFDGEPGSNTIPAAALLLLPSGPGLMSATAFDRTQVIDTDWGIVATVSTTGNDSQNQLYEVPYTIQ